MRGEGERRFICLFSMAIFSCHYHICRPVLSDNGDKTYIIYIYMCFIYAHVSQIISLLSTQFVKCVNYTPWQWYDL